MLPKINSIIPIIFHVVEKEKSLPNVHISNSVVNYLTEVQKILNTLLEKEIEPSFYKNLIQSSNTYDYLFQPTEETKLSICKIKPYNESLFEFIELAHTMNLFEYFQNKNIHYSYFGKHSYFIVEYMNLMRENKNDIIRNPYILETQQPLLDFIYYEINSNDIYNGKVEFQENININMYTLYLVRILNDICLNQNEKGICVIKLNVLYYKPVIDILYILSTLYEKCCIIKPITSNNINSEKYLVCKKFNSKRQDGFKDQLLELTSKLNNTCDKKNVIVESIIDNNISCFFLTKLEECNVIIGHQQIEHFDKLITMAKSKNKEEKMDSMKKINIQKCILWCEKYKLPHYKILEKNNIFLERNSSEEKNNILEIEQEESINIIE